MRNPLFRWAWLRAVAVLAIAGMVGCDEDRDRAVSQRQQPQQQQSQQPQQQPPQAQTDQRDEARPILAVVIPKKENGRLLYALPYPTGEVRSSTFLLEKLMPEQVRLNEPFQYQIRVTNLTEATLAGVTVAESAQGLEVQSSNPPVQRMNQPGQQAAQSPEQTASQMASARKPTSGQQPSTRPAQQGQQTQGQQSQQQGQQAQQQDQQSQPGGQPTTQPTQQQLVRWQIGELGPRASQTIEVTAVARQTGELAACLAATAEPAMCSVLNVINPQLQLTLQAPNQTYRCDPVTLRYTLTNTGTGPARNVVIQHPLPDGLTTAEGQNQVSINVGELPANQPKTFDLQLKATRTGDFKIDPVAKSEGDQARAQAATIAVRESQLAVQVQGPEWQYVNQPTTYNVRVENTGEVPAREVRLLLDAPGLAQDARDRKIGTLEPGQTREVPITLHAGGPDQPLKLVARAEALCSAKMDKAQGVATTEVRGVPALRLEMVDNTDPVQVGQNTIYTITVKNQGSAPAKNVQISGNLPQQLKFVSGQGVTNVNAEGQKLNIDPLDQLAPGDAVSWQIQARADQPANALMRIELKSESLPQPVPEAEPTRLIAPQ